MGGLENFDKCLDPPDAEWCEEHDCCKPCYECRVEQAEYLDDCERDREWEEEHYRRRGGG